MTQSWHDLLFAHWPVDSRMLAAKLPPMVELDVFDGQAWLGIAPFRLTNVAPRGVPALPWVSAFPELNVRTYVRVGEKPGVYFFSLDAGNALAVGAARAMFHLPYFTATMTIEERGEYFHYRSRRSSGAAEWVGRYRTVGEPYEAAPGSLDYFLTERYCLYTTDGATLYRGEIHHPPWPLQRAEAEIEVNTMADAAGIRLPTMKPLLHFSRRQDVVVWPLETVS